MKGGISETRIEKRIVITGDTEIDHDKVRYLMHTILFILKNGTHALILDLLIYKCVHIIC